MYFEQGTLPSAKDDIDAALGLVGKLPASHVQSHVWIDAGLFYSFAGEKGLPFFDQAARRDFSHLMIDYYIRQVVVTLPIGNVMPFLPYQRPAELVGSLKYAN